MQGDRQVFEILVHFSNISLVHGPASRSISFLPVVGLELVSKYHAEMLGFS